MAEITTRRGGEVDIAVNARPAARARKHEIVDDAKHVFENDGQRRETEPKNIGNATQVKHQSTPVHKVQPNTLVNVGDVRDDRIMVTAGKLSSQFPPHATHTGAGGATARSNESILGKLLMIQNQWRTTSR